MKRMRASQDVENDVASYRNDVGIIKVLLATEGADGTGQLSE